MQLKRILSEGNVAQRFRVGSERAGQRYTVRQYFYNTQINPFYPAAAGSQCQSDRYAAIFYAFRRGHVRLFRNKISFFFSVYYCILMHARHLEDRPGGRSPTTFDQLRKAYGEKGVQSQIIFFSFCLIMHKQCALVISHEKRLFFSSRHIADKRSGGGPTICKALVEGLLQKQNKKRGID